MIELKNWLFDNNIFFETKFEENCHEFCFKLFDTEFCVYFIKQNDMIRMFVQNNKLIKTFYSNKIEEILNTVAIYNKKATKCQQLSTAVDFI